MQLFKISVYQDLYIGVSKETYVSEKTPVYMKRAFPLKRHVYSVDAIIQTWELSTNAHVFSKEGLFSYIQVSFQKHGALLTQCVYLSGGFW
jgi:hypothetical protein